MFPAQPVQRSARVEWNGMETENDVKKLRISATNECFFACSFLSFNFVIWLGFAQQQHSTANNNSSLAI